MDTDSFIVYIKMENIYVDIAKDVETRFDTSNYKLERPTRKNKQAIGLKVKLVGEIRTEFAALTPKPYRL